MIAFLTRAPSNLDESFVAHTALNRGTDSVHKVHVKLQPRRRLETFLAEVATPLQHVLRLAVHQEVGLQGVLLVEHQVAGGALVLVLHLGLLVLGQLRLAKLKLLLGKAILDHRRELLLVETGVGVRPERLLLSEHGLELLGQLPLLHRHLVALEVLLHLDVELGVVDSLRELHPELLLHLEVGLELGSAACCSHHVAMVVTLQLGEETLIIEMKVKVICQIGLIVEM